MNWKLETIQGKRSATNGETTFLLEDCPTWGIVALLNTGALTPSDASLESRRAVIVTEQETVQASLQAMDRFDFNPDLWRRKDQLEVDLAVHDWTFIPDDAFQERLQKTPIPQDQIMPVLNGRYSENHPAVQLVAQCADALDSMMDYSLTFELESLDADAIEELDDYPYVTFSVRFENETAAYSVTCTVENDDDVMIEMGEDSWWELDPHLWVHLFISAHLKRSDLKD